MIVKFKQKCTKIKVIIFVIIRVILSVMKDENNLINGILGKGSEFNYVDEEFF